MFIQYVKSYIQGLNSTIVTLVTNAIINNIQVFKSVRIKVTSINHGILIKEKMLNAVILVLQIKML